MVVRMAARLALSLMCHQNEYIHCENLNTNSRHSIDISTLCLNYTPTYYLLAGEQPKLVIFQKLQDYFFTHNKEVTL